MTPRHDSDQFRRRPGSDADLPADLRRMDSQPYGSYKSVIGDQDYGSFQLSIDRVQSDPYAPPSAVRVVTVSKTMGLPEEALGDGRFRLATADFLTRAFDSATAERAHDGAVHIAHPRQGVLQRSGVAIMPDRIEIRFQVQLSARGRSISGCEAAHILDVDVPNIVMNAFDLISEGEATTMKHSTLLMHIAVYGDYRALQDILVEEDQVAFVVEGSILVRRSGVSQSPMEDAVPFKPPKSLYCTVILPHVDEITGTAIEPGVTLIVGGGYYGKSTFLPALQHGVCAHIPDGGREPVATAPDVMKVRTADGRAVTVVDVSAFITYLPTGADTHAFSAENVSGSTPQAAAIMEAVGLGPSLLFIDENTSTMNPLIRDERIHTPVAAEKEPIALLVDRIGMLAISGVPTVMVMGGSGGYLDVAGRVLMLDSYRCPDVSEHARETMAAMPRRLDDEDTFTMPAHRVLIRQRSNTERLKTKSSGLGEVIFDRCSASLFDLKQVVDPGQAGAIAWAMHTILEEPANSQVALPDLLKRFQRRLDSEGLDTVTKAGIRAYLAFLAHPRMVDIGTTLDRYRGLRIQQGRPAERTSPVKNCMLVDNVW